MSDYIKREDAKTAIREHFNSLADRVEINTVINMMPSIDIVRCKECRYWQDNNNGYPHDECRWGKGETPNADDYCSYGEREGE